jgi:hypothetical protein
MKFSEAAKTALRSCKWPGNVRELRNTVIHISMTAEGPEVKVSDLPAEINFGTLEPVSIARTVAASPTVNVTDLEELEKQTILRTLAKTDGHQGKAAEQLGISRRTLSRKLKQYNLQAEEGGGAGPLGVLNREQQQYFRASFEVPITITTAQGTQIEARGINISAGGICVSGIENPLQCAGMLMLRFPMPETGMIVETKGRVAWADVDKKAGLRFIDFPSDHQFTLDRWLSARLQEEGWQVQTVGS